MATTEVDGFARRPRLAPLRRARTGPTANLETSVSLRDTDAVTGAERDLIEAGLNWASGERTMGIVAIRRRQRRSATAFW